jgi:hypothetical protein
MLINTRCRARAHRRQAHLRSASHDDDGRADDEEDVENGVFQRVER